MARRKKAAPAPKGVKVEMNKVKVIIDQETLSFDDVARLALGDEYDKDGDYSITVHNPATNCGESMDRGVTVRVTEGLIFSVQTWLPIPQSLRR